MSSAVYHVKHYPYAEKSVSKICTPYGFMGSYGFLWMGMVGMVWGMVWAMGSTWEQLMGYERSMRLDYGMILA